MGSGGVAIAALPTVTCLKVPFSAGRGGGMCYTITNNNNIYIYIIIIKKKTGGIGCV